MRTLRRPAGDDRVLPVGPAPRARLFVSSRGWGGRHRRRILIAAAATAVLLHVMGTIAVLEAPHLFPDLFGPPPSPPPPASQPDPPTIEMVEDQNRYAGGAKPAPPVNPTPPAPPAPPTPSATQGAPDRSDLPQAPTPDAEPVPPDAPQGQEVPAPRPSPQLQASPSQPEVDLDPADALGYGHQDDPQVIPVSPDDRHANKMPPYPRAAGRRGEEGSVEMLVTVGADGAVSAVEVAVSSGHPDLDRTATNAVSHWHFRPARQNGVAVPTQLMQVFNFKIER